MNIQQIGPAKSTNNEYVTLVLERRQVEAAIGALIALDLSRGLDHPSITSALAALRSQLSRHEAEAA